VLWTCVAGLRSRPLSLAAKLAIVSCCPESRVAPGVILSDKYSVLPYLAPDCRYQPSPCAEGNTTSELPVIGH
jgi:hypothetical protein